MKHREAKHREEYSGSAKYFFIIPLIAQLGASVYFVLALMRMNLLQTWQLALIIGVLLLLFAINTYLLIVRSRGIISKILGLTLVVIISCACLLGSKYARSATSFFTQITNEEHFEVQVYELRALKNSEYAKLDQLAKQRIGFISTNPNLEETKAKLSESLADYEAIDYEEIGSMLAAFYDNATAAVIINQSYLDFLEEIDSTFEGDTIVLHRFEITVKDLDLRQPVDIVKEPFIVYISGSDSRGTINDVADSDVNILAVVNPEEGKILLVNIPRDYKIQIYGTTGLPDKLKSAGRFGIETSKKTIEELLNIEINYVVKVGFQTVKQLVDAIDGVDVESDQVLVLVADYNQNDINSKVCNIRQGTNHLDGVCALRYARERKHLQDGDLSRGIHQQDVLTAIINKITNIHYVTRLPQILEAAKDTFRTSFTEKEITNFVRWQLAELKHWQIESIQIGTSAHELAPTYTISTQNMWMYLRDEASEKNAKKKIAEYLGKTVEEESKEESKEETKSDTQSETIQE